MKLTRKIACIYVLLFGGVALGRCYDLPAAGDDLIGENYTVVVKDGDSLTTIRQRHDVSLDELVEANPKIDFYRLKVGEEVIIPRQFILPPYREGIVINVPELRLYYFDDDKQHVYTFTVGLGRNDWRTPLMETKVVAKKASPSWTVPMSISRYFREQLGKILPKMVPPGPDNPLGKYALYLHNSNGYMIHGTNISNSVGAFISSGCVRLSDHAIEFLYRKVKLGTKVRIIHAPYKAGWLHKKLYLEVHQPVDDYLKVDNPRLNYRDFNEVIFAAARKHHELKHKIKWSKVKRLKRNQLGIPEEI